MGDLLLCERITLDCPASAVFDAVAAGEVPGWQLAGDAGLQAGTPITLPITLPSSMGGRRIDVIGRISAVTPNRRICVDYHLPWRGTVAITTTATATGGCEVRITASLDGEAMQWFQNTTGGASGAVDASRHPLGLLVSGSGPASVFAAASWHLAQLAVEEINADGGVGGQQLELFVGDDGTDPARGAAELLRLSDLGCRVVLTNVTSATFTRLRALAQRIGILLIYTPVNEGGRDGREVLRLGERPLGQLRNTVPRLMRMTGSDRWFLAGNDYSWPRITHRHAERLIRRRGGQVVGERYEPLGSRDFGPLLEAIEASGAELVISTFVGADEVGFERQFYASGLRERTQTLALALDESTREHIGGEASAGLWTTFGYFQDLDSPANREFLARYRDRFGATAPPVSSISESVYEAVHVYVRATRGSHGDLGAIRERLAHGVSFAGPRGQVRVAGGGIAQPMYLGRANTAGIDLVDQIL